MIVFSNNFFCPDPHSLWGLISPAGDRSRAVRAQNPNRWTARALPGWLFLCFFISDHTSLGSSSTLASAAARPLPTLFISHCCDTGEPVSAPQPTEASACALSPFGARTSKALDWGCGQLDALSDQAPLMTRCPVHPRALVVWGQEPHCAGVRPEAQRVPTASSRGCLGVHPQGRF